jgi:hypothetical protein
MTPSECSLHWVTPSGFSLDLFCMFTQKFSRFVFWMTTEFLSLWMFCILVLHDIYKYGIRHCVERPEASGEMCYIYCSLHCVGTGPRDSTREPSGLLTRHILQLPFLLLFVRWKLLYVALLFTLWILIGNDLDVLCKDVNETFIFVILSGKFVLLIVKKLWESWSVFNLWRRNVT